MPRSHTLPAFAALALLMAWTPAAAEPAGPASEQNDSRLLNEVKRHADAAKGTVGVSALHLETNRRFNFNAQQTFPMASTYKVAIAATVLDAVDRGRMSLATMVPIVPHHLVAGDMLRTGFAHPGISLSLANLLELMITLSDNSATDVLLEHVGGPAAVNRRLAELRIPALRVDRSTANILRDYLSLPRPSTPMAFDKQMASLRPDELASIQAIGQTQVNASFETDPRDSATPASMTSLLASLWQGKALRRPTRDFVVAVMSRTSTGKTRIRGALPPGTPVAHKTGTVPGITNDVGVVTLPDGNHLVLSIFIKGSPAPLEQREQAIAQITRTVFDYFILRPN
jgi:beta-lactamase class A